MKITSQLVVPPNLAADVRKRWRDLGGADSAIQPGSDQVQLMLMVDDRESADGKRLAALANELGATLSGPVAFNQSALYDDADVANAKLLFLDIGSVDRAVDQASLTARENCSECGLPRHRQPAKGGLRLTGRHFDKFDLFTDEMFVFVRSSLGEELARFRGARLTEVGVPASAGEFFQLTASSSLGYSADVRWGPPCKTCGRRRGAGDLDASYIAGMEVYPRAAWDGSDVVTSALYPGLVFVTQPVWKVVSSSKWRVPQRGVYPQPVHFVDDAEPVR